MPRDRVEPPKRSTDDGQRWLTDERLWIVLAGAALLLFTHFRCPLQEPQEARYAEIPRQMLVANRFVVPILHGQPYLDKPPLFYWLVMASYRVFGVHDWAARLVSCSAAFLCVVVCYAWGRMIGPRAAFLGAVVLCLSPRFVQLDRMVMLDGLLALWVTAAWAAGHRALAGPCLRPGWWSISALACGLGLLTKGPVALILVLPPLLALRWLAPRSARLSWRAVGGYLALAISLAAPWYLAVAAQDDGFLAYFFWFHHVQRFVEPFDHAEPMWYYLPVLLLGMLPWTLLLPGLIGQLRRDKEPERATAGRLFVAASLWCLLFFSLAGCKRAYYLLPAMPPLALALGCYLDAVLRKRLPVGEHAFTVALHEEGDGSEPRNHGIGRPLNGICGDTLLRQRSAVGLGVCAGSMFVLLLVAVDVLLPAYARSHSLRGQVRRHLQTQLPVVCYPRRWDSVSFYLRRDDVRAFTGNELPALMAQLQEASEVLLFVKTGRPGDSPRNDLLGQLPASLAFEPIGRQGTLTVGRVIHRPEPASTSR